MKSPSRIKFENWPHWFRSVWGGNEQRTMEVLRGYAALGQHHKVTLADIALRNNLWAAADATDIYNAGIAEGRRRAALEIFKLANADIAQLFELTKIDRTQGGKPK